jgi:predicted Zn-dependent protease with MMP-like domain
LTEWQVRTAMRDYYGILGIDSSATSDEIRHAYRRLAKMWHPDRYATGPENLRQQAERRMRLLTEAYAALSDPASRTHYDRQRQSASGGDSVFVMGAPINVSGGWAGIPGMQTTTRLHPETASTDDSLRLVIALLLGLIALGAVLHTGDTNAIISGGVDITIALAAALAALALVMGRGPIVRAAPPRSRPTPPPPKPDQETDRFVELVHHALDSLPDEFAQNLENVAILVRREPTRETLRRVGVKPGYTLLGLYSGVALTQRSATQGYLPAQITLFQGPIERHCLFKGERIEQQVRATLLHEVAHHFGMEHDEMPLWVKA